MKLTCLIIDDEVTARQGLAALVAEFSNLELIGTCANGIEAIDQIQALRPQLILLDVQMPGINGFEVLASLPKPWPHVIFITAHDQFALKAFDVNAVDYLLKPFSDERFADAVEKVQQKATHQQVKDHSLNNLITKTQASLKGPAALIAGGDSPERLVIRADGSIHLLPASDIVYVEAFDYYIKIHVQDRFYLLRETMKRIEERLPEPFLRIHKSYIVNLRMVKALHKLQNQEYEVELHDKARLKVSRNYRTALMEGLGL